MRKLYLILTLNERNRDTWDNIKITMLIFISKRHLFARSKVLDIFITLIVIHTQVAEALRLLH